jgi:hypothetical protein
VRTRRFAAAAAALALHQGRRVLRPGLCMPALRRRLRQRLHVVPVSCAPTACARYRTGCAPRRATTRTRALRATPVEAERPPYVCSTMPNYARTACARRRRRARSATASPRAAPGKLFHGARVQGERICMDRSILVSDGGAEGGVDAGADARAEAGPGGTQRAIDRVSASGRSDRRLTRYRREACARSNWLARSGGGPGRLRAGSKSTVGMRFPNNA